MRVCAIAIALVAAGCRHAVVAAPEVADTDDDDIPDVDDKCPTLASGCFVGGGFGDDDGCPEPTSAERFHVPLDRADRERLASIARSAPQLLDRATLVVTARALPNEPPGLALERATAIALRLEDLGAPLEHLVARAAGPAPPGDAAPGAAVEITVTGCDPPTAPTAATAPAASR